MSKKEYSELSSSIPEIDEFMSDKFGSDVKKLRNLKELCDNFDPSNIKKPEVLRPGGGVMSGPPSNDVYYDKVSIELDIQKQTNDIKNKARDFASTLGIESEMLKEFNDKLSKMMLHPTADEITPKKIEANSILFDKVQESFLDATKRFQEIELNKQNKDKDSSKSNFTVESVMSEARANLTNPKQTLENTNEIKNEVKITAEDLIKKYWKDRDVITRDRV